MDHDAVTHLLTVDRGVLAVLAFTYRARGPVTVRQVASETRQSTLAVIPILDRLVAEGLVARSVVDHGPAARPTWAYQVTAKGRRTYLALL